MPPIKGRMIRVPSASSKDGFSNVRKLCTLTGPGKKLRPRFKSSSPSSDGSAVSEGMESSRPQAPEKMMKKLRIPESIHNSLPSVQRMQVDKSFCGRTEESPIVIRDDDFSDDDFPNSGSVSSVTSSSNSCSSFLPPINAGKKGKVQSQSPPVGCKYVVKSLAETKFNSMIWDVCFTSRGDVVVSHSNGAVLCGAKDLKQILSFDNIRLGGGVATFPSPSDSRIVVICRCSDTVNIYSPTGSFLRSFASGSSPVAVAVNSRSQILVSDVGDKKIRAYDDSGSEILSVSIPASGDGYSLKWPMYLSSTRDDHILVVDSHLQRLLHFDDSGKFFCSLPMATVAGSAVLRPHGLCVNVDANFDLFVVDNAVDTVEVFDVDGAYLQTLVPEEGGVFVKPKVLRIDATGSRLLVGGMTGIVRVLQFVGREETKKDSVAVVAAKSELFQAKREISGFSITSVVQESDNCVILLD